MEWWYRFHLGLPARPEDLEKVRTAFPEILDDAWEPSTAFRRPSRWDPDLTSELRERIRAWLSSSELGDGQTRSEECPAVNCPKQLNKGDSISPIVGQVAHLMKVGGGEGRKPPLDEFLDVVRKVHKLKDGVKEVVLTDPYIYSDIGEGGARGGFQNLVKYLRALRLRHSSSFHLKVNPNPKSESAEKREAFQDRLKKAFPKITFGTFPPRYEFHDRFYLVRDNQGILKGVFGPSLNGLSANPIALVGQLEKQWTLERLANWI